MNIGGISDQTISVESPSQEGGCPKLTRLETG